MNTPFQDALSEFIDVATNYREAVHQGRLDEETLARRLAQAGDRMESALRQMMREEARRTFNDEEDARAFRA